MAKDWLDDLRTLHLKFAKQRAALRGIVSKSRTKNRQIERALNGGYRAPRKGDEAKARARREKRAEDVRKNRERIGETSTSSIVEKADDQLEGRGSVLGGLDSDTETV